MAIDLSILKEIDFTNTENLIFFAIILVLGLIVLMIVGAILLGIIGAIKRIIVAAFNSKSNTNDKAREVIEVPKPALKDKQNSDDNPL